MSSFIFISMRFAKLWGTGNWRKIQNENICLNRESNLKLLAFQPGALDHLAMLTVIDLWYKLLLYSNLWIYSTRLTMHVLNWLWLNVYWNWLSDILFISYTNVDVIYYCSQVYRKSKSNPNHALFNWITFCRCSHTIWIAVGKIVIFPRQFIYIAREQRKNAIQYL